MGMLAFFPWFAIPAAVEIAEFRLIPYERGRYSGPEAAAVDAITQPWKRHQDEPISRATLLQVAPNDLLADLDEGQRAAAFLLAEFVALSGLSRRRFFEHGGYSNRDSYRLVVQGFDVPGDGAALVTRRRDGSTTNFIPGDLYRVPKPDHVPLVREQLDVALLSALVAHRDNAADELPEGVISFNLANTDASGTSLHTELVLTAGAFERSLGCKGGDDRVLADKFCRSISPRSDLSRVDCARLSSVSKFYKAATMREAWIRDLYALRGDLAHGKVAPLYKSIWSIHEHLLLASFVFPLVVKSLLAKDGLYTLAPEDQLAIDSFETLACTPDLLVPLDKDKLRWPWHEALDAVREAQLHEEVV